MFGISGEHLILLVLALFAFGPKGLPKLGAALGKTARGFKDALGKQDPKATVVEAEFHRIDSHNG